MEKNIYESYKNSALKNCAKLFTVWIDNRQD